jgi:hypothetical protein
LRVDRIFNPRRGGDEQACPNEVRLLARPWSARVAEKKLPDFSSSD